MDWVQSLLHRIGLELCALGWHPTPFQKEPKPRGVTPEQYKFHEQYRCRRCGLVGRIDGYGNLDPTPLVRPGSSEEESLVWEGHPYPTPPH